MIIFYKDKNAKNKILMLLNGFINFYREFDIRVKKQIQRNSTALLINEKNIITLLNNGFEGTEDYYRVLFSKNVRNTFFFSKVVTLFFVAIAMFSIINLTNVSIYTYTIFTNNILN